MMEAMGLATVRSVLTQVVPIEEYLDDVFYGLAESAEDLPPPYDMTCGPL